MEFRVLGPVELWVDGRRRDLGTTKERCVLAALLLTPRRPVHAAALIARVWDHRPPAKARQSLYSYIARLRQRLDGVEGAALASRQGSYLIDVADEAVDLWRFRLLRDQARAIAESGDDEYALDHYRRAAELCAATPLADLSGDWVDRTRRGLEEEILGAAFDRIDIELHRGHHADMVRELAALAERDPFDERPVGRLMVALFRSGRQAEALEAYRRTRRALREEMGTEPGQGLRELHQRILRADPGLLRVPGTQLAVDRRPHNLPSDVAAFTGRDEQLQALLRIARAAPATGSAATVIAVDGMPGVGKSALAVHVAHRLAEHFPDGHIFLKLHAHDPRQEPLDPAVALDTLLRAIGVPTTRIPRALEERAALWRSQMAGGRAIIVLDDAAGHDQVSPLLPASPGCLVIVTSRRCLTGLHDAHPLSLDVLPVEDAVALFRSVAGGGRDLDDATVAAVVERCGYLPLAVRIAASRLRHRQTWGAADLLERLTPGGRLEELRVEGSEITVVFEVSYRGLPPPLRAAFRAFGLHPGPDLTAHAAAAILRRPVHEAERVLEELLDRHLLGEPARGRYRFHDLVHEYARRLAREEDPGHERRRTVHRVLDYYLAAADRADRALSPGPRPVEIRFTHPPRQLPPLDTDARAHAWFAAEHACLLRAASHAAARGWPYHLARFARVLAKHLETSGHWETAARLHESAVAALRDLDDHRGTAYALADLSLVRFRAGDYDLALDAAEQALAIYRSLSERRGEADILSHMSLIHWHRSRFADALARCQEALEIRRLLGDRSGEARSLDHTAIFLEYTGDYREALRSRERALAIFAETGDQLGRTMALNNMGDLALRIGDVDAAVRHYGDTAKAVARLGRQHHAIWLINMANVHRYTGDQDTALSNYRQALATAAEIGDRRSEIETLIGIGATFQNAGRFAEALIHHKKALVLARAISERYEETLALRHLGEALAGAGRHSDALDHFREAHDIADLIGVPYERAKALEGMGGALLHTSEPGPARDCWRRALTIFDAIGASESRTIRSRLNEQGDPFNS
ncbi:AfsR/SARP family transcriptional regulator [Actinomadura litoris]|uniref:Tetratricopeptide repeat protein n=1 Tax=Actinomadura litoris TaxID=2678616 RepID=A0A7K1KYZ0_9ACTN|nr:tetratricopeptide repeat protein [Actinomadura litoris]MUN37146.1 tetratricopeptide repeat protein [Actinomadura litoris]